jgi:nucleoid-associated protein YgaU
MRTLLALTVLMLVLAGAVWWKTRPVEDNENLPPTTISDSRVGVATVGMEPGTTIATDASFPKRPNTDADGDHEGDDGKTALAADLSKEDPVVPPTPPIDEPDPEPTPPPVVNTKVVTHTIVEGDNLYRLVTKAYGTAPEELLDAVAAANNLSDPGSLQLGQLIVFPVIDGFTAPKKP